MPDPDSAQQESAWSFDPTGGQAAAPPPVSIDLDPRLKLPPSYFMPSGDGTQPAAGDVFSGQYDGPAPSGGGNPLDAAAGGIDQALQHPGGSAVGINAGDKSLQIAPKGGIIPGLIDKVEVQPYIEGVPGMGPPGMPAPWESGH